MAHSIRKNCKGTFTTHIKDNATPAKIIKLKRKEMIKDQALFGEWQTEQYEPPDVHSDDEIPKNDHGNINLFTAEMLPKDCVWLTGSYTKEAAENLSVNYAEACTGFKFRGGRATPNVNGIVFHKTFESVIREKIEELLLCKERKRLQEIEAQAVVKWCRLLDSILIARRLISSKETKELDFSVLCKNNESDLEGFDDI